MVAQGKCRKALSNGLDLMFLNFSETFDTTCRGVLFHLLNKYSLHVHYVSRIILGACSVFVTPKAIVS